jgi:hypothetical protein
VRALSVPAVGFTALNEDLKMKTELKAKIYLSVNEQGKLIEWSAHLKTEGITIGVTKDNLKEETYNAGWHAYFDDLTDRGFEVDIFEHSV